VGSSLIGTPLCRVLAFFVVANPCDLSRRRVPPLVVTCRAEEWLGQKGWMKQRYANPLYTPIFAATKRPQIAKGDQEATGHLVAVGGASTTGQPQDPGSPPRLQPCSRASSRGRPRANFAQAPRAVKAVAAVAPTGRRRVKRLVARSNRQQGLGHAVPPRPTSLCVESAPGYGTETKRPGNLPVFRQTLLVASYGRTSRCPGTSVVLCRWFRFCSSQIPSRGSPG